MDRLISKLADDGTVMMAWSSVHDTQYLAMLARTDFDAITLDMQHGMQTESSVIAGTAAIVPSGKPVVVRIPVGRFDFASKALDSGVHAIIAPMINTLEDAKQLVSFTKYIPVGDRSFGPTTALNLLGQKRDDYVTQANDKTLALAMIETKQAVENMEAILDLDGIDGVFCGPADLSISVRGTPVPDPYGEDTLPIVEGMAKEAKARGKIAAAFCPTPKDANLVQSMGFRLLALGFDASYIGQGADKMLGELDFR
ncbi:MAG: aldolase/citrate lyase family protein [Ahrensia sp.]|nr:aldolase/citrate lyase family protein [Ahrensia sp.]